MTTTTKTTTVNALLCGENFVFCARKERKKNALSEKTHRAKKRKK